ncbi:MAG TPA: hypothetical protein ENJ09_08825 [Planctomycetes bacterium]|nr:hypothetical protein [Planctomycetota bacterium]
MRLLNLAALASSFFLAGIAFVQDGPAFLDDDPVYRMDCDDMASIRPSDEAFWERMAPVELSYKDALDILLNSTYVKQFDEVRVLSGELVLLGKPYYRFFLYSKKFNEKKQKDVIHRWQARVGVVTHKIKYWLIQERFPGTPVRGEIETLPSGVMVHDVHPGDGQAVAANSTVKVQFMLSLLDGSLILNTYQEGKAPSFKLKNAPVRGFAEGLVGARVGGKRKLIIPPSMGYGEAGMNDIIPPNATLVYDIEIIDVK